jgi:hypothetical protein
VPISGSSKDLRRLHESLVEDARRLWEKMVADLAGAG